MTGAVFYDGASARRRSVAVRVTSSSVDIEEAGTWIASWPCGRVRRRDAPEGILRLMLDGEPTLARLDILDPGLQTAIRTQCRELDGRNVGERTTRIVLWSMAAALSVVLCVIYLVPVAATRLTPLVPLSWEQHLGRAVDNQVKLLAGDKVCAGLPGAIALATLSDRLRRAAMPAAGTSDTVVDIQVLDAAVPNAIALPGGRIYLFRALLDRAESVDEIAGVLAHEMGHVRHRDGLRKLIQAGGTSYLAGLLLGDVTGGGALVLASRMLLDSAHSRDAETAADAFAGQTMTSLGRPAGAMAQLLARIERNESKIPAFLSTHPVTEQRLKALEQFVPTVQGAPLLTDEEWRALKEVCKTS
ncbi:M48 family metallopeptidase [Microvirga puerhi]|uniref:M48 family metallopeptidase n=1 Tax=Microvirga puerhi TaxID=2876078 RepID=A0ABS7VLY4_9HYPH|nr:M48 family metallopeptidase [Microvirga puerhi]MBZ6076239.1 M48 family metallopeptidase [Microvirga puerhi]